MKPVLLLQNCEPESPGTILSHLAERNVPLVHVHSYRQDVPQDPTEFAAVINMGTPISAMDYLRHQHLKDVFSLIAQTLRTDVPYLGVCFGGQILARAWGAIVRPNEVKEIGTYQVGLTETGQADPLFAGFPGTFPVFQWHGDTFRVPFEADLLVAGDDCKNQAFRKHNTVALQFHVEVTVDEVGRWCDAYADELAEFGKTRDEIVSGFEAHSDEIQSLRVRLLDNFLASLQA
jgi:GMP synthase-like glutamine amidotransferase